ncbi:MAG: hypothetical protein BGO25_15720 [Acidobacteriales bacterium 59-55]|nr:MAG: hypothetical protein BGO25_15720 [Acidobacteriales bacterium 59-55]
MPQSTTEIDPYNEAVSFQFAEMLGEHFLRCLGKHPAQLTQASWAMLKLGQNPRLPFTLNEGDCELSRAFSCILCTIRDLLLALLFGAGRIRLVLIHLF